jgi:vanillate O-demethylase monooxygenase subunit
VFVLNIRLAPTGTEEPEGYHMKVMYGMTPETGTTTHDFFVLGRDYLTDDAELSAFQLQQQLAVMQEDVDALEVQEVMVASETVPMIESSIRSDVAGIRGRRLLERMRKRETPADDTQPRRPRPAGAPAPAQAPAPAGVVGA